MFKYFKGYFREIPVKFRRATIPTFRHAIIPTIIFLIIIIIGITIGAQYHDASMSRESNFSKGMTTFGAKEGSGLQFPVNVRILPNSWEQLRDYQYEFHPPNRIAAYPYTPYWGSLYMTEASFDPVIRTITIQAQFQPAEDLPEELANSPITPLKLHSAWFLPKGGQRLAKISSQINDDMLTATIRLNSNGIRLWPFDKYEGYLWIFLEAPPWITEGTIIFDKSMDLLPQQSKQSQSQSGIKVLPIAIGFNNPLVFSAPPGYHFELGISAGSNYGAALWILDLHQRFLFPQIGFMIFSLLYCVTLFIMWRYASKNRNTLLLIGITLTLIFSLPLLSDFLGEPSVPWPTMVDMLRFIVILFSLLIIVVSLVRTTQGIQNTNEIDKDSN